MRQRPQKCDVHDENFLAKAAEGAAATGQAMRGHLPKLREFP